MESERRVREVKGKKDGYEEKIRKRKKREETGLLKCKGRERNGRIAVETETGKRMRPGWREKEYNENMETKMKKEERGKLRQKGLEVKA